MKQIFVNLKRFDIPNEFGGINTLAPVQTWGKDIMEQVQQPLEQYKEDCSFCFYLPESQIINAVAAKKANGIVQIGCQSVYREDVSEGGNFGAFTSNRPAAAMKSLGCESTIIGHCEERKDKAGLLAFAGVTDTDFVHKLLNQQIKAAVARGFHVLYCVGETTEEQATWETVLSKQLKLGLEGVPTENVTIAYEPVWAIGPGKTPPDKDYIAKISSFIKAETNLPVVYGGGLKKENAEMIASIPTLDGGLIALTRFTGNIGFYPDEFLEIVKLYTGRI